METNGQQWLHWRAMQDNTYLRAELLKPGEEKVVTIKSVNIEKITSTTGAVEERPVLHFVETDILPMVANITNCKTIEKVLGSPNIYDWAGKKIQIFATNTKVAGTSVPCLRVRNFAPKGDTVEYKCSVCGKTIPENSFKASVAKYGKAYCSKECLDIDTKGEQVL